MKKVYLDHGVVCSLSQDPARSWCEIAFGKVLATAIEEQRSQVYTSPTEVMEIFLTAKTDDAGNLLDASGEERGYL